MKTKRKRRGREGYRIGVDGKGREREREGELGNKGRRRGGYKTKKREQMNGKMKQMKKKQSCRERKEEEGQTSTSGRPPFERRSRTVMNECGAAVARVVAARGPRSPLGEGMGIVCGRPTATTDHDDRPPTDTGYGRPSHGDGAGLGVLGAHGREAEVHCKHGRGLWMHGKHGRKSVLQPKHGSDS